MAGQERRVYERAPYFGRVTVSIPAHAPPVEGRTMDISLGGVGLSCPVSSAIRSGESIAVTFHLVQPRSGPVEERLLGRVAWIRTEAQCCLLGIEFLEPVHPVLNPAVTRLIERL
jgi:c-di-GMP-binding flagellar brake protein YcgR